MSESLDFPVKSRFNKPKQGIPIKHLQSVNINKAVKRGTTYKNLYFTNVPLHPGMDDANEPKSVNTVM